MENHDKAAVDDVRMRGFAHRHTVEAALAWLDAHLRPPVTEMLPLRMAECCARKTSVYSVRWVLERYACSAGHRSDWWSPATNCCHPVRSRTVIESSTPTDRCSPPSSSATADSSTSLVWCLTNTMRS